MIKVFSRVRLLVFALIVLLPIVFISLTLFWQHAHATHASTV